MYANVQPSTDRQKIAHGSKSIVIQFSRKIAQLEYLNARAVK